MPFTVSHIAAVLPLHKPLRRLGLLSAAAIGAMAPDLDLLLPIHLTREQTHGRLALLTFCLPVGLATWVLFQALIKPALIEVLPNRVYARLCAQHLGPRLGSVKVWFYAALAVLFGALTHIIWDGFTHEDGRGVRMLPLLGERGPELAGSPWHLYRWLQHGSSVVGMAAVFMALWLWVRHARRPNPPPERRLPARERHRWVAVYILIPVLLVGAAVAQIHYNGWPRLYSTAALTLFAGIGINGTALALVFTSALIRRRLLILGARRPLPDA
ncbi:MAG: DUF4184 family protein, partial [Steroidobacteraceae bacterium]